MPSQEVKQLSECFRIVRKLAMGEVVPCRPGQDAGLLKGLHDALEAIRLHTMRHQVLEGGRGGRGRTNLNNRQWSGNGPKIPENLPRFFSRSDWD